MRRRRRREDPIAYRIEYSAIAQRLHAMTEASSGERRGQPTEMPDEVKAAIAAARHSVAAQHGRPRPGWERPSERARQLIEASAFELRRLGWKWVGSAPPWYLRWARWRHSDEDRRLGEFLDGVLEPAAVVLYWSCKVEERAWAAFDFLEDPPPRRRRIDRYRLARGWNRDPLTWLEEYLAILREGSPSTPVVARILAWLGLTRLRSLPAPSYRVHYNLACLFTRLAMHLYVDLDELRDDYLEEAMRQLRLCMSKAQGARRESIREWARRDPALDGLRRIEEGRFEEIVGDVGE